MPNKQNQHKEKIINLESLIIENKSIGSSTHSSNFNNSLKSSPLDCDKNIILNTNFSFKKENINESDQIKENEQNYTNNEENNHYNYEVNLLNESKDEKNIDDSICFSKDDKLNNDTHLENEAKIKSSISKIFTNKNRKTLFSRKNSNIENVFIFF